MVSLGCCGSAISVDIGKVVDVVHLCSSCTVAVVNSYILFSEHKTI